MNLVLASRTGRIAALSLVYAKPGSIPAATARATVRGIADSPGFSAAYRGVEGQRFVGGNQIDVPVMVAFGSVDRVLHADCRLRAELPPQHQWLPLDGCGHVPMSDAPDLVAGLILDATPVRN